MNPDELEQINKELEEDQIENAKYKEAEDLLNAQSCNRAKIYNKMPSDVREVVFHYLTELYLDAVKDRCRFYPGSTDDLTAYGVMKAVDKIFDELNHDINIYSKVRKELEDRLI